MRRNRESSTAWSASGAEKRNDTTSAPSAMSIDSRSPRDSSQDYKQFSKGESLDQIKPMRKDGGPENADASKLKSDLSIESINRRADR